jgi:hypothetical protein
MSPLAITVQAALTLAVTTSALTVYHRFVLTPSVRFAVVDVGEVYRLKEKQILQVVTKPSVTDADKQAAVNMTMEFAKALPAALEQLHQECKCFVLVRSAVAAETPNTLDLTPLLKQKVGV